MKFEKLNENKIRITLTIQDLAEKEIDFHVFMSNSAEAQDVLLDMLEQAKPLRLKVKCHRLELH